MEFKRFANILEELMILIEYYNVSIKSSYINISVDISESRGSRVFYTDDKGGIWFFLSNSGLGKYLLENLRSLSMERPIILPTKWPSKAQFVPVIYRG